MTYTDAIYTKREAEQKAAELMRDKGGRWDIEKCRTDDGRRYRVVQTISKQAVVRQQALAHLSIVLSPEWHPFSQDSRTRFGNYYAARDRLQADLDKFAAKFAESPLSAFEWGTSAIETAAEHWIVCGMIAHYEREGSVEDIYSFISGEASRAVDYDHLSGSTSPMSNLVEDAKRIAYNKIAKQLKSWLDERAEALGDLWAYGEGLA